MNLGSKTPWVVTGAAIYARKKKEKKLKLFSMTHVREEDKNMVMMSMKPYTEIVKYMSTWSGFLALGWGLF